MAIKKNNLLEHVSAQDLKAFGLIPEICGRFPVITHLCPLDADSMKRILLQPKNALVKQYTKLLAMDNIELTFEDEALEFIVQKALDLKLGARGLRAILEHVITDAMFNIDIIDHHLNVNVDYVKEKCANIIL